MSGNRLKVEIEKAILSISRSVVIIASLFVIVALVFIGTLIDLGMRAGQSSLAPTDQPSSSGTALSPVAAQPQSGEASTTLWTAPEASTLHAGNDGEEILYGKDLITNTSAYFGPNGKVAAISNGMNCQNCHLDAGTKPWGNNYSAVYSTYPKFRARSGTKETIVKRISDCFERSLNGRAPDTTGKEMKAMLAYMQWHRYPKGANS